MKIRKLLLVFFISLFFCFFMSAKTTENNSEPVDDVTAEVTTDITIDSTSNSGAVNWFTKGMPVLSLQWGVSFPSKRDLRNPMPSEDLIAAADFRELRLNSGLKYQYDQLDFTNNIIYMPTFFNTFQTGLGLNWHFYRYFQTFTENDLIISARFRWIKGPVFSFENAIGGLFKFAAIDAIRQYKPCIFNFSYHFSLLCNWKLNQKSDVWCALNLQDYFDYPLAVSPFFKFGADYALKPEMRVGADVTLKYVDMFFSAVYLNECILRLTCKVVL